MADFQWCLRWSAAVLSVLATTACGGSEGKPPELRETRYGVVRGVDDSAATGTYAWKGIPFAKPPVGELRWQPPVEPVAWSGERNASQFGNACLQMGRIYGPGANNRFDDTIGQTLNTPVGNEDCLTLNIWRPATSQDNLPVLLFLHGGSAISGYTADPVYDGAALARAANAVVVTANYRLDVLGFMQLPQLHGGGQPYTGNYALLDNVQALRFIQNNIAGFGGNAGNVTLMGQSAGAINALALLTAPQAAGLFHKLLPVSGGISLAANLPPGSIPTLNPASRYATQSGMLLAHLALADGLAPALSAAQALVAGWPASQVAGYLRGKDARVILQTLLKNGLTGSGPIPDGVVVPADPIAELGAGRYHKVPVLSGYTADEGKLFAPFLALLGGKPGMKISDADRFAMMQKFNPDAPTTLTAGDILDASYLPVTAPGTGVHRPEPRQPAQHPAQPAIRGMELPVQLGAAARALERRVRRGACVRPAVPVWQLRALGLCQGHQQRGQPARPRGALQGHDGQRARLRAHGRSEQRDGEPELEAVAQPAPVRRRPEGRAPERAIR
jgi:para-nitrobenzyl esterase